jgi:hypothetical protein
VKFQADPSSSPAAPAASLVPGPAPSSAMSEGRGPCGVDWFTGVAIGVSIAVGSTLKSSPSPGPGSSGAGSLMSGFGPG